MRSLRPVVTAVMLVLLLSQFEWPRIRAYFDGTAPAAKE
jgi:hypothetical protein